MLKALTQLLSWAMGPFHRQIGPAQSITGSSVKSSGEAPWTEPLCTAYLCMFRMHIMRMRQLMSYIYMDTSARMHMHVRRVEAVCNGSTFQHVAWSSREPA